MIGMFESRYNKALNDKSAAAQKEVLLDWLDYGENAGLVRTGQLRDLGLNPVLPGSVYEMLAKQYRKEKNSSAEIGVIKRYFALPVEDRDDRMAERFTKRLKKAEHL